MNIKNMLKLADLVEKQKHVDYHAGSEGGFNMGRVDHDCGAPSCIAGFAAVMAEADGVARPRNGNTFLMARKWLDIPVGLSWEIFAPPQTGMALGDITPHMAAWTLRNLAETGRVEWKPDQQT